ncbi:hypothetical protein [Tunturiibacter psychrotolerans]|uniref:hypothetical protein n=1 Tax=Tunturiibacter psychrotolerans TaxID=3069686 RepID=UPI003D25C2F4
MPLLVFPIRESIDDNDMKLRKEDQEWLAAEICRVVKFENATLVQSLNPRGGRRVIRWLKEWGAISALWAVPLALFAMVITLGIFAANGISKNAAFQSATETRLSAIEKTLEGINHKQIAQDLTNHAVLPLDQFGQSLSSLSSSIATAREQKVLVSQSVIGDIKTKLIATNHSSPDYWPAAAQVVNYRSQSEVGWDRINLPACSEKDLKFTVTGDRPMPDSDNLREFTHGPITLHNCALILDSPEAQSLISRGLSIADVNFDNCVILYNGGPITFKPIAYSSTIPPLTTAKLNFMRCVFILKLNSSPPAPVQRLTTELLAANTDIVRFSPNV